MKKVRPTSILTSDQENKISDQILFIYCKADTCGFNKRNMKKEKEIMYISVYPF